MRDPVAAKRQRERVEAILKDPDLFPDEFVSWIPKMLETSPTWRIPQLQLPLVDKPHLIGATGEPAFQNSWVNEGAPYQEAGFFRDLSGVVHLFGSIQSGSAGVIFVLPVAYRPAATVVFTPIEIEADGEVRFISGSNTLVPLDGITFRAQ
jgi:hypothetical protein